ncbi:MAG TPA: hypothetical protein VHT04_05210 [Stellaceae bacterium]|nr:hypothetical protein [Stellaceae bacterium]
MNLRLKPGLRYLSVLPVAIMALWTAGYLGMEIPNQPGVLLLAVVYSTYRGGLGILAGRRCPAHPPYRDLLFRFEPAFRL